MLNLEDDKSSQLKIVHSLCQAFQVREHEHILMVHEKCKFLFRNGSTGPGALGRPSECPLQPLEKALPPL